jgi:hypothetical protein
MHLVSIPERVSAILGRSLLTAYLFDWNQSVSIPERVSAILGQTDGYEYQPYEHVSIPERVSAILGRSGGHRKSLVGGLQSIVSIPERVSAILGRRPLKRKTSRQVQQVSIPERVSAILGRLYFFPRYSVHSFQSLKGFQPF